MNRTRDTGREVSLFGVGRSQSEFASLLDPPGGFSKSNFTIFSMGAEVVGA